MSVDLPGQLQSFRKPRTGFPILFHYASLNRNEGRHELGGPLCLKVERAESPVPLALSLWLDSSLVGGIEQGGNQNAANRLSHSLRCLLPHLIRFFGSEEGLTEELHFNLRDEPENAEALVFDRERGGMSSLLPDLYMLDYSMTHRSSAELSPQSFATRFLGRRPQIFWRGSTTGGNGLGSSQLTSLSDLARNPRVLACLRLRDIAGSAADCKITRLVQCADGDRPAFVQWLTEQSVFDLEVEEQQFALYQMYLDLPGNGSAWGTFKKYLYGCLVIVPESSRELAYHRHLSPWHHFIPVKADLSDIAGIVSWVYDNQAQAASIAFAGRAKMLGYLSNIATHVSAAFAEYSAHGKAHEAPALASSQARPAQRVNVTFLQTADLDLYRPLLEATSRTVREYCGRRGYAYESFCGVFRGHHPWQATYNRIVMLRRLLEAGFLGWACYLDADAYIADLDFDLDVFLTTKENVAMVFAPGGSPPSWWNVNAGVCLFNFAHPVARSVVRDWFERFDAITDLKLQDARDWDRAPDDQTLLWESLKHVPDAETHTWIDAVEPRTLNYDGRFIKQVLRASGTLEERLRVLTARIDTILGSVADQEVRTLRTAFATALYRVALMREPDPPGLLNAVQALQRGQTFEEALTSCFVSHEFAEKFQGFISRYVSLDLSSTPHFWKLLIDKANPGNSARRGTTPRATAAGRRRDWRRGGRRDGRRQLTHQRRQRDANRLEHAAGATWCLRP